MNQQLFMRRISGLSSHYIGRTDLSEMPDKVMMPPDEIEMSDHQYMLYQSERYSESKKEQQTSKKGSNQNSGEVTGSAFRTYSRMVSNFAFPEEISRPKPISSRDFKSFDRFSKIEIKHKDLLDDIEDDKVDPKSLDILPSDDPESDKTSKDEEDQSFQPKGDIVLTKKQRQVTYIKMLDAAYDYLVKHQKDVFSDEGLKKYSPKILKIIEHMTKSPGNQGLIYIYTEYRILEGVRIMGEALIANQGYERIDLSKYKSFDDIRKDGPKKRYGVISSEENENQRKLLMELSKHPENAHGEYLKVIMGTSASSQGINLKGVTQVHIMEPYWNLVRNNQVIGRAIRMRSHNHLPKEEREVFVYSYRMKLTLPQQEDIINKLDNPKEATSTEEYVHRLAVAKDAITSKFLRMNRSAAVDCNLNYLINVTRDHSLVCMDVPEDAGKYMYYPDINQDPSDYEYAKSIKYENFVPAKKMVDGNLYGFKAYQNGQPVLTQITYQGKTFPQVIVMYDYDLLVNNIEVKRKYYILGLNKLIDAIEVE